MPSFLVPQASSLNVPSSSGAPDVSTIEDIQTVHASLRQPLHQSTTTAASQSFSVPQPAFITPAMWQESVASVYEGGLKRSWDYDVGSMDMVKRR